ncbi:cobalamin-dependent protein [Candidatus Sumerlaeota bacterium]|nr:cobalamin-dependent protein [Candidatus Sumerlaeota bacterium]
MKILLVKPKARLKTITRLNPLIFLEPLELGYVAAAVPEGHEIHVLDLRLASFPRRAFARRLRQLRPDAIGISGYSHEASEVIHLAAMARKVLPAARIVVGGHHATVFPGDYNTPLFDAIVRGEGCAPFRAVVEKIAAGRDDFETIENVMAPGARFDAAAAERLPRYPDPATLPFPRRDLWDPAPYRCIWPSESHPPWQTIFPRVSLVRASFGCCMDCSFCVVPSLCGGKHMPRPPDDVAEEIAQAPNDRIYFCDDESFIDPAHARAVAEAIARRGIRKRYFAWARSTTVNRHPDLFVQWREIGLDAVFLGFEAVTDEELRRISKHATVADNERAHAALRERGIAVQAGFMVHAGFGREDFRRLKDYIRNMPPAQVTCTVYTPSPGSRAWYEERDRYVCDDPFALHDCMHPLTPTVLPLREFLEEFAAVSNLGPTRNPLRAPGVRFPFRDIFRVVRAASGYSRALKRAYRDYPRP